MLNIITISFKYKNAIIHMDTNTNPLFIEFINNHFNDIDKIKDFYEMNKNNINISANNYYIFTGACEMGYLLVVKWLIDIIPNLEPNIIHIGFDFACINGHLNLAQWLYKIYPFINISEHNEQIFRFTCEFGHLDVAKWLMYVKPSINVCAHDNTSFKYACLNGHLHVAKWLQSLKPNMYLIHDNDNNNDNNEINCSVIEEEL